MSSHACLCLPAAAVYRAPRFANLAHIWLMQIWLMQIWLKSGSNLAHIWLMHIWLMQIWLKSGCSYCVQRTFPSGSLPQAPATPGYPSLPPARVQRSSDSLTTISSDNLLSKVGIAGEGGCVCVCTCHGLPVGFRLWRRFRGKMALD